MRAAVLRAGVGLLGGMAGAFLAASPAAAHALHGRVDSPLPFEAYVLGAAAAVALSFVFVARGESGPVAAEDAGAVHRLPAWVRLLLRVVGLVAWAWVVAQTVIGGTSEAEVASLILWTFGWVGLPIVSALVGPVWPWLDPFSTLHDLGSRAARRLGFAEERPRALAAHLGAWPAVGLMVFFVWLELALRVTGGRMLGAVLIGYTLVTLAGMAAFGRDEWRSRAEVFGVWLGLLGRLAPFRLEGRPEDGRIRRQAPGSGLLGSAWSDALVALVGIAAASVIYDGLSQTQPFYALFGVPTPAFETLILGAFLALISLVVIGVARLVGPAAVGAGLVPVALGYLVAHYLTQLLVEGQRILVALSDPFQLGWDLLGTAFWSPREDLLPTTVVWGLQVAAVVGGHVAGAWLGHLAIGRERASGRPSKHAPLALVMVGLTALTLWSLGQNLAFEEGPLEAVPAVSLAAGQRAR